MRTKPFLTGLISLSFFFTACSSNEIGDSRDVNQDKIYMDYFISHDEGDNEVEVYCTFRFAGNTGTTLVLSDESKVEFDGEALKVDSSTGGGAFYKTSRPLSGFYGKHTISFTSLNGKKYVNEFDFAPFAIDPQPIEAGRTKDLTLAYRSAPLTGEDYMELYSSGTDSSFHYSQKGPGNSIVIPSRELMRQKVKTLSLECRLYREIQPQQSTSEGGLIRIRQELRPFKIKLVP